MNASCYHAYLFSIGSLSITSTTRIARLWRTQLKVAGTYSPCHFYT